MPIPDIMSAKNVLCFGPHPDDIDLAAGATLAKLTANGTRVTLVTMTDGRMGYYDPRVSPEDLVKTRRTEEEQAAQFTGIQNLMWFSYHDGELPENNELRDECIRVIREVRPDFVLTLDPFIPYEAHPDHIHAGKTVLAACLFSSMPGFAPGTEPHAVTAVALAQTNRPNTLVDVTETFERKIAAMGAHASQFPPQALQMFGYYLQVKAQEYGQRAGVQYAEAFKVLTPTHLHFNPDAEEC